MIFTVVSAVSSSPSGLQIDGDSVKRNARSATCLHSEPYVCNASVGCHLRKLMLAITTTVASLLSQKRSKRLKWWCCVCIKYLKKNYLVRPHMSIILSEKEEGEINDEISVFVS